MTEARNAMLGELAADAALERSDFLAQAGAQLHRFLEANRARISEIGGMTLIDDDPDYLSIAPDMTFRVRSRYLDDTTNEWVSETEVVESAAELVELYNPSDIFAAFAEGSREAAGLPPEPTAADELMEAAGIAPDETVALEDAGYAAAADAWAAGQEPLGEPTGELDAARRMYDLALSFQERSQRSEARLLEQFEDAAARLAPTLGELVIVDDDDERLVLMTDGSLRADVLPEDADGAWRSLHSPDDLVEFYDPTDVFGDLADAIAEAWPDVAPEMAGELGDETEDDDAAEGDDATESDGEVVDDDAAEADDAAEGRND